jgi:DNA mismatch repair ATPase MutS
MLRAELGFYVSCLNLADQLAARGVPTLFPEPVSRVPARFSCTDLRDTSLALQATGAVLGNDVRGDGKQLVIITGANSGGKSTFLRSAGQAQLMMQCGLFVTAQSYRANLVRPVFTHFIREEDAEMTSGRLGEELQRMSAIADEMGPGCLMLFNESFAGTNEREGAEVGRQIIEALLGADMKVFFVTHRYALAEPGGRRSYKLAAKEPLPTSYGEDLYYQYGRWLGEPEGAPPSA